MQFIQTPCPLRLCSGETHNRDTEKLCTSRTGIRLRRLRNRIAEKLLRPAATSHPTGT